MKFKYEKTFLRDLKKLKQSQRQEAIKRIKLFQRAPRHPLLHDHPLKGRLKGLRSINLSGDLRAHYRFDGVNNIIFLRLGTHSTLY